MKKIPVSMLSNTSVSHALIQIGGAFQSNRSYRRSGKRPGVLKGPSGTMSETKWRHISARSLVEHLSRDR
eukprot:1156642-Pelagomonas_calceolata.AAC.4